jgi:hypothetical protein
LGPTLCVAACDLSSSVATEGGELGHVGVGGSEFLDHDGSRGEGRRCWEKACGVGNCGGAGTSERSSSER